MNGKLVACPSCGGAGLRTVWSFGVKEPDECKDCGGGGQVHRYESGVLARHYGGPLIGKEANVIDRERDAILRRTHGFG